MNILLHVLPEDIEHGQKNSGSNCAIARAIKRQLPYAANVLVGEMIIQIDNKKWILPNSIASWIATFDLGWQPEPISILLPERNVDEEVKWELLEKA
jgi:hypothetical protein